MCPDYDLWLRLQSSGLGKLPWESLRERDSTALSEFTRNIGFIPEIRNRLRSHAWVNEPHIAAINKSTLGVVFLGTPHQGADIAAYAKHLARTVGLVKQTNDTILKNLQRDSKELTTIQEAFDIHIRSRLQWGLSPLELKCFFEENPVTGVGVVVNYASATLPGTIPVGISKDHREMTRFASKDETGSSSPGSSPGSSFVKIPPGGRFIINEQLVALPFKHVPLGLEGRETRYFQPREDELGDIHQALFPSASEPDDIRNLAHRTFSIYGLGGAGKTELVYRYYTRFRDQFDAVFFLVADRADRLQEQYSTISHRLGLVDKDDHGNHEVASKIFMQWLSDPVKGAPEETAPRTTVKWLLIFDNAESSDVLTEYWPPGTGGKIIITTQNPEVVKHDATMAGSVRLGAFPANDAVELLKECAQDTIVDSTTEADASTIVEWVECFPMAIVQLGRIIRNLHLSISQFRKHYSTKQNLFNKLNAEVDSQANANSPKPLESLVTHWALGALQTDHKTTFALLGLISLFDPELIQEDMLKKGLEEKSDPTYTGDYIELRRELVDRSLVDVNIKSGDMRVHRIVQDVTKEMVIRAGQAESTFQRAIHHIDSVWPFLNRDYVTGSATKVNRWDACQRAYPHIVHLKDVHEELLGLGALLPSQGLAELLLEAAQYCNESGKGHEASPLLDAAEKIYWGIESTSIDIDELRATVYRGRIGLAATSKNGDDLLHYAQLTFDIEKERHRRKSEPSSLLAVAYNDLATGWAFQRHWSEAIRLLEESRKIREILPGFTRDKLFSPLYHLALVYHHQRRFEEAESVLNQAIKDREDAFGAEDAVSPRSAALFYARGNVRLGRADRRRGDLLKGLADFKEAVQRATRSVGAKNRITLMCLYQLARVHMRLDDYETASQQLDEILTNSVDSPVWYRDTTRAAYLYAQCLRVQDDLQGSEVWYRKSLEMHNIFSPEKSNGPFD
ncbi:hypothetical protein PG993_015051 [Apiospora rasikravindrae]|uniref:DUF7779 domain-containing protein n=1 Tax=Apiospora rasikravindrae TaxID=990691 RepID=A0ABR1RPP7_9PEZI